MGPRDLPVRGLARITPLLAAAALIQASAPTAVAGQAPDSTRVPLDTLRVDASRLGSGDVPLSRIPVGSQVVRTRPAEAPGLTIGHALAGLTGVTTADVMGAQLQPDITMRGFGVSPVAGLPQSLSVFIDGVRVNEPDASQVYFQLVPLHAVERIEVLRGPSGPFGRNALAGAVNLVTRRVTGTEAELTVAGSSAGEMEAAVLAGATAASLDALLSARYLHSDGWRDASLARLAQLFTRFGWQRGGSRAWLSYTHARDSVLQAGSLPLSWIETPDSVPARWRTGRDTRTINFTGGDYFGPVLHFLTAGGSHRLGRAALDARVFHRRTDIDQFNANFTEPDTEIRTANRSTGIIVQMAGGGVRHRLSAGSEYTFNNVRILIREHANENFTGIPPGGVLAEDVGTREHNIAAFLQGGLDVTSRLTASGMLRFDHVTLPFRDALDPGNDGDNEFRQLTGSVGVDWEAGGDVVLFSSLGRGFRAPTIMELACADPADPCPLPYELGADPPLAAVTADTWQAGARVAAGRGWTGEAVVYRTEVHDDIFNVQAPESRAGYFTNLERTRREGLELSIGVAPVPRLSVEADLAFTRATFRTAATLSAPYIDDDADEPDGTPPGNADLDPPTVGRGSRLPMVPDVSAELHATADFGSWSFTGHVAHTGRQWLRGDEDNTEPHLRLPAHTVVGASAARALGSGRVVIGARNLLDHRHLTYGVLALNRLNEHERVEPFVTPGPPRRFFVRLEHRFH